MGLVDGTEKVFFHRANGKLRSKESGHQLKSNLMRCIAHNLIGVNPCSDDPQSDFAPAGQAAICAGELWRIAIRLEFVLWR